MSAPVPALRLEGITRSFPGVLALADVTLEVAAGSCHALCGENGAGKSTLGRIVAGVHAPDRGTLAVFGRPVRFEGPGDALAAGVAIVHQELASCENLTVAENLCLGALPARRGIVSRRALGDRAAEMLAVIEAPVDPRRRMAELTPGQQQMVQIASAVARGARIIVFDEPTSSLSQAEAERLYALLDRLRADGVTALYVSHRMDEIFRLCDTITVLRDGRHVATRPASALDRAELVRLMIGRALADYFPAHVEAAPREELLRVTGLSSPGRFRDVSFTLRAGEVVGLAGLVGAGRSDVAHALFGLDPAATGEIRVGGQVGIPRHPAHAMRLGIGLVPEDRKRQGLVLSMSAMANVTLPILGRLARAGFVRRRLERSTAGVYFERLRVRAPSPDALAAGLSGGNQQKLVLARWLAARCQVLVLDEPTRGVDVGAKAEIHALVDELAASGHAVLLVSSDLPEVLALSTRVLVMRGGRLVGELPRAEATPVAVLAVMAGVPAGTAA